MYRERGTAVVQKIPTPITPIDIDRQSRHITLAYFDRKSTVDYIGIAQGIALCFDCKECATDTFALQNIHEHQFEYMRDFARQGGIAFLLIYFSHREQIYFMGVDELREFYERGSEQSMQNGQGRRSFRCEELRPEFFYDMPNEPYINYLEFVNDYLEYREQRENTEKSRADDEI